MRMLQQLRAKKVDEPITGSELFDAIYEASSISEAKNYEDPNALEIVVRLLDSYTKGLLPEGAIEAVEHLVEECGLYPYLEKDEESSIKSMVNESFSVQLDQKIYLHAKQMEVLSRLEADENVVLSAPTSFGKSLIVDAFIASRAPSTVLIIVPTIALIDETRRRLERNFGKNYKIITKQVEEADLEKTIFVLTQERYLARDDIEEIDFLFVDEFYKLDPNRKDTRFQTLNVALFRALRVAKQTFLAGPNISSIDVGPDWIGKLVFIRSTYQTVTVNTLDRSDKEDRFNAFLSDLFSVGKQQSLVYTRSPASCRKLVTGILKTELELDAGSGGQVGEWIRDNYHPEWILADACDAGIALHHGKVPRSLSQMFVELFNNDKMQVMICTSTLIEGVNTSAENVFVYDNEINTTPLDYFSFANIRGRVGRMMRHFVGNVFIYSSPPEHEDAIVEVPVLSSPDTVDDYILMNYQPDELGEIGRKRQATLPLEFGLRPSTLKQFAHYGVETLVEVKGRVHQTLSDDEGLLDWGGPPSYEQSLAIAEFIRPLLKAKKDRSTRLTTKQMAWAWSKLRKAGPLQDFLVWFQETFSEADVQEGIERAFEFLNSCEFNHATAISAVDALVSELNEELGQDYSYFVHELETWFRPSWMKELDEMGIPIPLSERLSKWLPAVEDHRDALHKIAPLLEGERVQLGDVDRMLIARCTGLLQLN